MKDTWPLLDKIPFPPIRRGAAANLAGQCRLPLQPVLRALPRQRRPNRTEEMDAATVDVVLDISGEAPHRDARHHRRRAGAERATSAAW